MTRISRALHEPPDRRINYGSLSGDQFQWTYRKAGFVCEGRATVPGLYLIPEDNLYLALVFAFDQWLHDLVNGHRKLLTDGKISV
jgi:hypothetical protein